MKKKVYIFGREGNMGSRYAAILRHLGHTVTGNDLEDDLVEADIMESDAIIIATPTDTHLEFIAHCFDYKKPILCEKPLINHPDNIENLREFLDLASSEEVKLSMVSQYDYYQVDNINPGLTAYNYYRTGKDGLAWDCINIIWRSKSRVLLNNTSPIWLCSINGTPLRIDLMDYAYIQMIDSWLANPYKPQYQNILDRHLKVLDYLHGRLN